jgi:regulator of replication initiation timing
MSIFDVLKLAANYYKDSGKMELYNQTLEVQEQLLEMRNKITNLEIENKNLKEKLKLKIIYDNNAYWINKEGKKDGPYCSRCWDKNKDLIGMHPTANPASSRCPNVRIVLKQDLRIIGLL